jgi:hypothetical protein
VKVNEGLVLAADSTAAILGSITDATGKVTPPGILKTYDHVRKLSQIKDYPIGTLAWGAAQVGARTVESIIRQYEHDLPSLKEEQGKVKEQQMRGGLTKDIRYDYSVKKIAQDLLKHVKEKFYEKEFAGASAENRPPLGILVSGYSSGKFFPEQWLLDIPNSQEVIPVRPDVDGKPDFGANWFGLADAIIRLHWGRDEAAIDILSEHFKVPKDQILKLLDRLQYFVLYGGMPLQDAIDYAVYLVNVVIGRFRFVVGAPLCGGEIDVAVITPNEFTWIQRKSWGIATRINS